MDADPDKPKPEGRPSEHTFEEGAEAPPPGVRVMALVRWGLLAIMAVIALASMQSYLGSLQQRAAAGAQQGVVYHCPMHPQITSDRPGECPICHMSLEPIAEGRAPPPASAAPSSSAEPPASAPHALHPPSAHPPSMTPAPAPSTPAQPPAPLPKDVTPIRLGLDRTQAIGVRTALVALTSGADSLRANASVEAPEQGRAEVRARAPGFVEAIQVTQTGVKVRAGEPLVGVYSPEILQAEQELLTVSAWASPSSAAAGMPPPPIDGARRKLELLGLDKAAIDRVVAAGKPARTVSLSSPISGYVVKKSVVLGSYVTPEVALFEIADLRRVYIVASLHASQLAAVHAGDAASFTTPSLPGRVFEARIDLLYPDVDLATRTGRVRLQVDNKDLALLPGQFGAVELRARVADALTIPADAVLDTGRAVYVFVVTEEGERFEPRAVRLGEQIGERVLVQAGLTQGERVVSGATFLIDAESRLQASFIEREPAR